jgi:diaminohydroxyphosphoribosylaminopyrimidine deaminase/5-amino-6-(5-phosphoribosylamino)uracil reductase
MRDDASKYMLEAVALAEKAWGMTSPNPLVGAIIVKDGAVIGRGFHKQAGTPHAEINALADAGELPQKADLYVTLEPCSTYGRTPPCSEAIIRAGIGRVFIGSTDPNPVHAGRGAEILRNAGIEVITGIEQSACDALNEAFFKWITVKTPFVLLKMAMTLDGKIATENGQSKWITGPAARQRVQRLRQWADAILVGGSTARLDHPSLTVRDLPGWRQPRRLVASKTLTAEELKGLLPEGNIPEIIKAATPLEWQAEMCRLGSENVTALLVEGGGELAATVLAAGIVDKVEFHIAPKILGGRNSRPVVGGANPSSLAEALALKNISVSNIGEDIVITGYPGYHSVSKA